MVTPKAKKEDLVNFVKNCIIPLKSSSYPLNALWEYMRRELSEQDILYIPEKFKKVVLGGIKEDGSFSPNSLAEFYSQYFGIGLTQIDRVKYINSVKNGIKPEGITIKSDPAGKKIDYNSQNDFSMSHYVYNIDNLCNFIINKSVAKGIISQSDDIKSSFNEGDENVLIDNPSQILSLIKNFYNASLNVLPTYNEYSLFLNSINGVSKDYILEAYPSIINDFSDFINLLDLKIKPIVDHSSTQKYIEYIFPKVFPEDIHSSFPEDASISSNIFSLFKSIFGLSNFLYSQTLTLFDGVRNEYLNFLTNAKESVKGILDTTASKLIKSTKKEFKILVDKNGFTKQYSEFPNQHISALSKSISPLLFSGCAYLEIPYFRYADITIYNNIAGVLQ